MKTIPTISPVSWFKTGQTGYEYEHVNGQWTGWYRCINGQNADGTWCEWHQDTGETRIRESDMENNMLTMNSSFQDKDELAAKVLEKFQSLKKPKQNWQPSCFPLDDYSVKVNPFKNGFSLQIYNNEGRYVTSITCGS